MFLPSCVSFFFFFNDTATTEIYTLSLHDALPISRNLYSDSAALLITVRDGNQNNQSREFHNSPSVLRSEEHTSELQSQSNLVCRLLLEKKKKCKQPNSLFAQPSYTMSRATHPLHT